MELEVLKRILSVWGSVLLSVLWMPVCAQAQDSVYPMIYGRVPEGDEPVMELSEAEEVYTVLPGDSLWSIAEKFWGGGSRYEEIIFINQEVMQSPDLIYPGMDLKMAGKGYIVREEARYGGVQMGKYSLDTPYGWTLGTLSSGDAFSNFALSGQGIRKVACLIQDKKKESAESVENWEECAHRIEQYAWENYGDQVSDLVFSHYLMGEEELVLYSFTYQMKLDGTLLGSVRACAGMKLTEHIQAEFIGFARNYDIEGCVRYITASFEEHSDGEDLEKFTVNDSNMMIAPETEWEIGGMVNSFAWVDEFFSSLVQEAAGSRPESEETDKKQELIERMSRRAGRRTGE